MHGDHPTRSSKCPLLYCRYYVLRSAGPRLSPSCLHAQHRTLHFPGRTWCNPGSRSVAHHRALNKSWCCLERTLYTLPADSADLLRALSTARCPLELISCTSPAYTACLRHELCNTKCCLGPTCCSSRGCTASLRHELCRTTCYLGLICRSSRACTACLPRAPCTAPYCRARTWCSRRACRICHSCAACRILGYQEGPARIRSPCISLFASAPGRTTCLLLEADYTGRSGTDSHLRARRRGSLRSVRPTHR